MEQFSALVQHYPQNAGLHFLLALAYFDMKELRSAEASVRQAIRIDPKTPQVFTLLANIEISADRLEEAEQDFRRAIEAEPLNLRNYLALEAVYAREGNWEDAKKVCEKAHEVDPNSPVVANELAYLYLDHGGDVNVAVSMAQMAKQKMPRSPSAADALGWAYYRLGSLDSAVSQLKEAVVASPHNSLYQYHLGITYKATRQFGLAEQSFQRALKDNPNSLYAASAKQALKEISTASR